MAAYEASKEVEPQLRVSLRLRGSLQSTGQLQVFARCVVMRKTFRKIAPARCRGRERSSNRWNEAYAQQLRVDIEHRRIGHSDFQEELHHILGRSAELHGFTKRGINAQTHK
jgi:hypothetical protein